MLPMMLRSRDVLMILKPPTEEHLGFGEKAKLEQEPEKNPRSQV